MAAQVQRNLRGAVPQPFRDDFGVDVALEKVGRVTVANTMEGNVFEFVDLDEVTVTAVALLQRLQQHLRFL